MAFILKPKMKRITGSKLFGPIAYAVLALAYLAINRSTPLDILLFLLPFFMIAATLPVPKALDSLVPRILFSLVVYSAGFQVLAMLLHLVHIKPDYKLYLVLGLSASALMMVRSGLKLRQLPRVLRLSSKDSYALVAATVLLLVLLVGMIGRGGLTTNSGLRLVSGGLDGVSHLSMTGDEYRHNTDLLVGSPGTNPITIKTASAYPKGWHAFTALAWHSFYGYRDTDPAGPSVNSQIRLYALTTLVYFFIAMLALAAAVIWLADELLAQVRRNGTRGSPGLIAQPVIYMLAIVLVAPVFKEGFFSFYPVFLYALVSLIAGYYLYDKANPRNVNCWLLCVLLLSAAGVTLSWLLIGPVLYLYIFLIFMTNNRFDWHDWRKLGNPELRLVVAPIALLLLACAVVSLAQALIQVKDNGSVGLLSMSGGIVPVDLIFSLTALAGFIAFCATCRQASAQSLIYLCFAIALEAFVIWGYQLSSQQALSYYFYKVELPLILMLAVAAGAALVYLSSRLSGWLALSGSYNQRLLSFVFTSLVIMVVLFISGNYSYNLRFMLGARSLTRADASEIETDLKNKRFSSGSERVYFLTKSNGANVIGTAVLRLSHPLDACDSQLFTDGYTYNVEGFKKDLGDCLQQTSFKYKVIVEQQEVYESLTDLYGKQTYPGQLTLERY